MTSRLHPHRIGAALALTFATHAATAQIPAYDTLQQQARSNLIVNDDGWNLPPGSSFNSITATLNDAGQVAFPVQLVPIGGNLSNTAPGVWLGTNGSGGIVATLPSESIGDRVAINATGQLAYYGFGDAYTLRRWDAAGGEGQVGTSPLFPTGIGAVSLSDDGVIGWRGSFSGGQALVSTLGTSSSLHAQSTGLDPASTYAFLYTPSMNASRLIAAKVNIGTTTPAEIRVFASDGSSTRVVADTSLDPASPFDRFDNSLAFSDGGSIAVVLRVASGTVRAVYRFDPLDGGGYAATEIARVQAAGTIREIDSFPPDVNDDGLVVFRARDAAGQAIYVGDGSTLVRVVGQGTVVDTDLGTGQVGQHDTSPIFSGAPTINAAGAVAFIAGLHPQGNNQVEWGSGVFVAKAASGDTIFTDGFDG
ncbi:choice-of-anchor tandem repeat NxxGxxAF-containing protein [Dokdonella sp. MW10]|uniref:choice-of-anchor tandem repeat NxxGxxAF-containing protein n=1 Tax=Dokdonella sp. MW10 TaxID=2992926 RepID=UPI003F80D1BA